MLRLWNLNRQDAAKSQLSMKKGTRFLRRVAAGEGFSGSALSNEQSIPEGVRCISFCRGFMSNNISVLRGNCGSEIGNFAQTLFVRLFELTSRPEGA